MAQAKRERSKFTETMKELDARLHDALLYRDFALARELIAQGADINARDDIKQTALHWILTQDRYGDAVTLLEMGADPNIPDNEGLTPMHTAVYKSPKLTRLIAEAGGDPNRKVKSGMTTLHLAVGLDKPETVRILIEHGADPYIRDGQNRTAYDVATLTENPEPVRNALNARGKEHADRLKRVYRKKHRKPGPAP